MFLTATVTKWQDSKYSGGRVSPRDGGHRQFILNTSCMYDIRSHGTGSKLYFTDKSLDSRDSGAYLEITQSVDEIRVAGDTVVSKMITLPFYRDNNPNKGVTNVVITSDSLIYADRYNSDPIGASWVMIAEGAFKIKPGLALVALSIEEILSLSSLLKDYDGNGYTTVTIGTQEWIVENLKVTHYSDGTAIPNITDDTTWLADSDGAYCYYENDSTNFDFIGLLYNNYTTTNAHGLAYLERNGVQEIGWRVPTQTDMLALIGSIGGITEGKSLKEIGFIHWDAPNLGATDEYGFKWISGGNRYIDIPPIPPIDNNGFYGQGIFGDLWTTTEEPLDPTIAFGYFLGHNSVDMNYTEAPKYTGQNVRLVRDI